MSNASFLVYTNTPVDYRVTVKSASVDSVAEQAIELLARTCESRTDGGSLELAAVMPRTGRSDGFWAVRSFDCGQY